MSRNLRIPLSPMPIIAYYLTIYHIYFKPLLIYKITHKVEVCSNIENSSLNHWRWTSQVQCCPPHFPNSSCCPWHWSFFWSRLAGAGRALKEGKEQGGGNHSEVKTPQCHLIRINSIYFLQVLMSWDICEDCKRDQTTSLLWENGLKTQWGNL